MIHPMSPQDAILERYEIMACRLWLTTGAWQGFVHHSKLRGKPWAWRVFVGSPNRSYNAYLHWLISSKDIHGCCGSPSLIDLSLLRSSSIHEPWLTMNVMKSLSLPDGQCPIQTVKCTHMGCQPALWFRAIQNCSGHFSNKRQRLKSPMIISVEWFYLNLEAMQICSGPSSGQRQS